MVEKATFHVLVSRGVRRHWIALHVVPMTCAPANITRWNPKCPEVESQIWTDMAPDAPSASEPRP
jgi:hypothetical protein